MKFVPAQEEHEVLDKSPVDDAAQARADKRMKRICATPDEVNLYQFAPNRARNQVNAPGMPLADSDYEPGKAQD